jgi:REP element-mobilizing transposase RayT
MITNNPGHLKGFNYIGLHRYSLTFCTDRRRRLFTDADAVELVVQQLLRSASEHNFSAKRFVKGFKQYSGYYYTQKHHDRLWQRYGFEHVLRDEEVTIAVAKYILANPVRAGLAETVDQYPYVGSLMYELKDLIASMSS